MSDLWLYTPEICDGDYCPMDCDKCYKADAVMEAMMEEKTMAEYIEREAALEECEWYANEFCECEYAIMPLKGALENLPAADVRPVVRARWEYNPGDNIPYCSECMMPQDSECNFCPNCGADMREENK